MEVPNRLYQNFIFFMFGNLEHAYSYCFESRRREHVANCERVASWVGAWFRNWTLQFEIDICICRWNYYGCADRNEQGVHSLCNHVTLYGLASPRLLHSLNDHIKSSHSFKHGCNNGHWVVLYALVSPQWSHAWFWGRVRTILFPATKLCPCVNKLGGSV